MSGMAILASSTPYIYGIPITGAVIYGISRMVSAASTAAKNRENSRLANSYAPPKAGAPGNPLSRLTEPMAPRSAPKPDEVAHTDSPVAASTPKAAAAAQRSVVCTRCSHQFPVAPTARSATCPICQATLPV